MGIFWYFFWQRIVTSYPEDNKNLSNNELKLAILDCGIMNENTVSERDIFHDYFDALRKNDATLLTTISLTKLADPENRYEQLDSKIKKEIEKKIKEPIQVIDLCWLSDIDISGLLKQIGRCSSVLIVDECRRSGCYGEGLMVDLLRENTTGLKVDLHTAENSFIPVSYTHLPLPTKA